LKKDKFFFLEKDVYDVVKKKEQCKQQLVILRNDEWRGIICSVSLSFFNWSWNDLQC